MEERMDIMTDNQYYGIWRMAWLIVYKDNPDSKALREIELMLRKQDVEELRANVANQ